jgi:DNA-binding response OmpR family regulator
MRGHVLIVDDDPNMCELLEAGLKRRDFDVRTATALSAGGHPARI